MVRLVERIEIPEGVCYGVDADNYEEAKEVALEMYQRELADQQNNEDDELEALRDIMEALLSL